MVYRILTIGFTYCSVGAVKILCLAISPLSCSNGETQTRDEGLVGTSLYRKSYASGWQGNNSVGALRHTTIRLLVFVIYFDLLC